MKKLVLLFGAFAFIGCGEKKKSGDTAEGGQDTGPIPVAEEKVETPSSGPEPLISDADIERFAKDALDLSFGTPPIDYTGWSTSYDRGARIVLEGLWQMKQGEKNGLGYGFYRETAKVMIRKGLEGASDYEIHVGKIREVTRHESGEMLWSKAYYRTGENLWTMNPADAGAIDVVCWHKNGRKAATMLWSKEGNPLMEDGAPVFMKIWNEEGKELDLKEGWKMVERLMPVGFGE